MKNSLDDNGQFQEHYIVQNECENQELMYNS
jgi:hypothetical protein